MLLPASEIDSYGKNPRVGEQALTPDTESPVAEMIRRIVGMPQGQHDVRTEALIKERNLLQGLWNNARSDSNLVRSRRAAAKPASQFSGGHGFHRTRALVRFGCGFVDLLPRAR